MLESVLASVALSALRSSPRRLLRLRFGPFVPGFVLGGLLVCGLLVALWWAGGGFLAPFCTPVRW